MNLDQRINAFVKLGGFLGEIVGSYDSKSDANILDSDLHNGFKHQIKMASEHNAWFTKSNILYTLGAWSKQLTSNSLNQWLGNYNFKENNSKKVAIIMAGNIPLVGFHDFISVLLSGNHVIVKQSSNDKQLLPYLAKYLVHIEPKFKGRIEFTEDQLTQYDAVIATGSNNSARYFEYYFKEKPSIIRKNRNSVAVLTGNESGEQLKNLSEDIFRYYGLGCRNVSKIFVPIDYNFDSFFNALFGWKEIINEHKYANNYDYNKAVYLMSEFKILDNGFFMLKEDESYSSPIATAFYERYKSLEDLKKKLVTDDEHIQCIVSNNVINGEIEFGKTQQPNLWDFADNVDTIEFLSNL